MTAVPETPSHGPGRFPGANLTSPARSDGVSRAARQHARHALKLQRLPREPPGRALPCLIWARLGAAAYAARAVALASPDRPEAAGEEIAWQLSKLSAEARSALLQLPSVGEDRAGPLGPGLLSSGELGAIIRAIQAGLIAGNR